MKNKIFGFFLLCLVLFSCGKKGPLILETEKAPPAVENFQVRQIGDQIELAWKFPNLQADTKGTFEMSGVSRVYVYHAILKPDESPSADIFLKKAKLLAKLKAAEIRDSAKMQRNTAFRLKARNCRKKYMASLWFIFTAGKNQFPVRCRH